MAPVHVQPVGHDPNPYAGIAESPQALSRSFDDFEVGKQPAFGDGGQMHFLEEFVVETPLSKVPGPFERQCLRIAVQTFRAESTKCLGVVGTHPIEVYAEHKC